MSNIDLTPVNADDILIAIDYLEEGDLIAMNGVYAIIGSTRIEGTNRIITTENGELVLNINAKVFASMK